MDTQTCTLKFGSWSYDESGLSKAKFSFLLSFQIGVNLTTDSNTGQLDAYIKSAEWDLECMHFKFLMKFYFFLSLFYPAFVAIRKAVIYECCPAVYPFVLFIIQIRRRTLYYVVNVVGKLSFNLK